MPINISEALVAMRKAGPRAVRAIPMPGQDVYNGSYMIEISQDNAWVCILEGLPRSTAESLITQATSRVLLG